MKKIVNIFVFFIFFISFPAHSASLDELYRDLIKDDNEGYLPMFVKNRNVPESILDEQLKVPYFSSVIAPTPGLDLRPVDLVNDYKIREAERLAKIKDWENAIKAVQQNKVTPIELNIIMERINENDAKAIEIYAWMNAKGVGVKQDLITAFQYYMKAESLQVPDAKKNATLVYKAMTKDQRASLSSL